MIEFCLGYLFGSACMFIVMCFIKVGDDNDE